ncbi:hypothetical protein BS17DRAFT_445618 [Gyrodon lividus]|nr:hypothetical protein BS17DRAFT_445618 [Gyrodon lividus]
MQSNAPRFFMYLGGHDTVYTVADVWEPSTLMKSNNRHSLHYTRFSCRYALRCSRKRRWRLTQWSGQRGHRRSRAAILFHASTLFYHQGSP